MNTDEFIDSLKINYPTSQMRTKNQMMSRVQRKEDCLFNNQLELERQRVKIPVLNRGMKARIFNEPDSMPDTIKIPERTKTFFLRGKR